MTDGVQHDRIRERSEWMGDGRRDKTYLQREKDWKPRDHVRTLLAHCHGIRAQFDARVEFRLEVAGQTVADAALAAAEGEAGVAGVVRVAAGRGEGGGEGVREGPGCADGGSWCEAGCGGGGGRGGGGCGGEVVDGVQHYDPGRFGRRRVR